MQVMPTRASGDITYEKITDVGQVADGVGFEPTKGFHPCRFSRPVHSTALPPIQT